MYLTLLNSRESLANSVWAAIQAVIWNRPFTFTWRQDSARNGRDPAADLRQAHLRAAHHVSEEGLARLLAMVDSPPGQVCSTLPTGEPTEGISGTATASAARYASERHLVLFHWCRYSTVPWRQGKASLIRTKFVLLLTLITVRREYGNALDNSY